MLTQLIIQHFALIEHLELDLRTGLSVITGVTGAGKSIMLDALLLALGERANSQCVTPGAAQCEVIAVFNISALGSAQQFLQTHALAADECILRRIITSDGRSKAFINGTAVTLTQLRALGELLVSLHGQHEQQGLLNRDYQLALLDHFAGNQALLLDIKRAYQAWHEVQQQIAELQALSAQGTAKLTLLRYQCQELDEASISATEVTALHQEQQQLTHQSDFIAHCQTALAILQEDDTNLQSGLKNSLYALQQVKKFDPAITNIIEMLTQAEININEAAHELTTYASQLEVNPSRLTAVEQRLDVIHGLARKHHVAPEALPALQEKLTHELQQLDQAENVLATLNATLNERAHAYQQIAAQLSARRTQAATQLSAAVINIIRTLGMPGADFSISLTAHENITLTGNERAEFLVTTNPGQPSGALAKIASGGELSRIGLAIHVCTAKTSGTPTLIFDEVDVGISGGTAEIVGKLLRELGAHAQVLCITHQPQVAALGHQHYVATKQITDGKTATQLTELTDAQRTHEIARMVGGVKITETTLAHAKEMLEI